MEDWKPKVGDIVLYTNKSSLRYAWDEPEEVKIVAIGDDLAWVEGFGADKLVRVGSLSPKNVADVIYFDNPSTLLKLCDALNTTSLKGEQKFEVMKALQKAGVTFKGEDDDK